MFLQILEPLIFFKYNNNNNNNNVLAFIHFIHYVIIFCFYKDSNLEFLYPFELGLKSNYYYYYYKMVIY